MPHGDGILLPAPHRPSIVDRRHARLAAGYQHFIMYCCASVFGDTVVATAVSSSGCPAGLVRFSRRSFSGMESFRRFRGCYTAFLSGAVLFRLRVFTFGEFASISLVFFSYFSVKTTTAGVALGASCSRRRRSAPPRRQFGNSPGRVFGTSPSWAPHCGRLSEMIDLFHEKHGEDGELLAPVSLCKLSARLQPNTHNRKARASKGN